MLGSLGFALGVVGFSRIHFTPVRAVGRSVHPESLDSLGFALGVVGFIRGRWIHTGSRWGSLGSSGVVRVRAGVVGFARFCP